MAEIVAFRGIRYDTRSVDASSVLAPPYDVIDAAGRERLAARDPANCVRLILPSGEGDARYERAAARLRDWLRRGILVRDAAPSLYRYHQVFRRPELGPDPVTRRGFIAAVRLHGYDEGVIRPHERTLRGPKRDRLDLWAATRAHLSPVFTLYSDPAGRVDRVFERAESGQPVLDGVTDDGTQHIVWRVDDAATINAAASCLRDESLYIADGHHRYETMLALRDRLADEAGGALPRRSAANYGMLFLANIADPGFVVLPTHRLVTGLASLRPADFLPALATYFDLRPIAQAACNASLLGSELARAGARRPSMAVVFPGDVDATLLMLREDVDLQAAGLERAPSVLALDVTLLHELVFDRLLGIDPQAQEAQTHLEYVKDTEVGLARVRAGDGQALFVMNATPVEQVVAVADAGEIMPQKSTFFYPKLASGTVICPVRADETL